MNRLLGMGVCQLETDTADIQKNMDSLAGQIKIMRAYSPWIKLVCAPELCLQGPYHMASSAETIPGPISDFCADLARKHEIYLIPGSLYEKAGNTVYNTSPVFTPQGKMVARYRKMYPWRPYEKTVSGSETVVFDIAGVGRVGVCICYDLWFPEVIRDLVFKGAEVIMVPTLTGTQDRSQEIILCRAAAIANQCYVASINGASRISKGESLIVDPEGNIMQKAGQLPENLMAMLDLSRVDQVRQYGTCGVSRPVASFLHESHRFPHQEPRMKTPLLDTIDLF
ncbi:MAG: carbon-nitrogen hydrolase family protein [Deltaproteobacteria bacterium]|nr:carbon-nitrogen hydrolase family protein [Deltaproteobacteria bacterium]